MTEPDKNMESRRGFHLPTEVRAKPFGVVEPGLPGGDYAPKSESDAADLPSLADLEAALPDKLHQIAILLRGLTCEEMWKFCEEGLGKPTGFDKELVNWARRYMGEPEETEAAPTIASKIKRRA